MVGGVEEEDGYGDYSYGCTIPKINIVKYMYWRRVSRRGRV